MKDATVSDCVEDTCLIDVGKFVGKEVKDSAYRRPAWFGDIPFHKLANNLNCRHPPCSEQVHLQIGAANEIVVSFVSSVESQSKAQVFYSLAPVGGDCNTTQLLQNATGSTQQYTLRMYFSPFLMHPNMGEPTLTPEELAAMRSTDWCQDTSTGWKYPCYHHFTAEDASTLHGSGRYSNFKDQYDSPSVHTVVLKDLAPNQRYCYSVDNDQRVFSFKTPGDSDVFPYKIGL